MTKRVLVIAYLYPPINNSGTQRPLKFTKYLPSFGWTPTVITAANLNPHPLDANLLKDIPREVSIVRVPMLNDLIGATISTLTFGSRLGARLAEGLSWRLRQPFKRPDLYALWRPTARRAALRIFRQCGFDAIYATGYPWTSLLIGCDVATATGRPLLADFRDPWAAEDMFTVDRLPYDDEFAMERSVVRRAARVITVSDAMTRLMQHAHPELPADKFVTIHNGFDPPDFEVAPLPAHNSFRIVYTGVWTENYGPTALYDAIEAIKRTSPALLDDVEVIAAGFEPGEARRRLLDSHISELGRLSHDNALSLMRSADVLFLPNGAGSRQAIALPGKLFEYLATARPVLALTDPEGEAGQLLKRTGGGAVVKPGDPASFAAAVADICKRRRLETGPVHREAIRAFERSSLTRKLASLLDESVDARVAGT
jgi:glycosyltransferase involved in cell wall biosynthesis